MAAIEEIRTVTSNGRIVVPWSIQQALGLEQGGPVCFRVENGVVTLHAAEDRWGEAAFVSLLDGEVDQERKDHLTELSLELENLLGARERQPARTRGEPVW